MAGIYYRDDLVARPFRFEDGCLVVPGSSLPRPLTPFGSAEVQSSVIHRSMARDPGLEEPPNDRTTEPSNAFGGIQ
jgi:hypothetical protein